METSATDLINKFKEISKRSSLELAAMTPNQKSKWLNMDIIQLKYLADAGDLEAMLAYAKLCFDGRHIPVNKPYAFKLVTKLLNDLSTQYDLAWIQSHLDDGFIAKVIQYQNQHQYGTAFAHKLWVWANQARLNFTRIAVISKLDISQNGPLDDITKHPVYASLAFVMFTARLFYDLGVFIYSFRNAKEAREVQGNLNWAKQFAKKDDKWLRYLNDVVWASLGVVGFTLSMVGIEGLPSSIPLVLGYLFDVAVEIYKGYRQYNTLSKEIAYLGGLVIECESKIKELEGDPENAEDIKKLKESAILYNNRMNDVRQDRTKKVIRSVMLVTGNFLLFAGMFIGKLTPVMTAINPMIGFGIVLAASGLILLHKAYESIRDYSEQKLKDKINKGKDINNQLVDEAFWNKHTKEKEPLLVTLNQVSIFRKRRKVLDNSSSDELMASSSDELAY